MSGPQTVGPVLLARGGDAQALAYSAILITAESASDTPASLVTSDGITVEPVALDRLCGHVVWRYDFSLQVGADSGYRLGDTHWPVATDWQGRARVAYVSCNGKEDPDPAWPVEQRNAMWQRLADEHRQAPLSLLLHGGDQLYADQIQHAHPTLDAWTASPMDERGDHSLTDAAREAATRFLFDFYMMLYSEDEYAYVSPRVPSLMMWDDHDIMDGWGSHPVEMLDSEIGKGLYAISRRMFMLFQLGEKPDHAMRRPLGFHARFGSFAIVAPDLRSERRPDSIMGDAGWQAFEQSLDVVSSDPHVLLMSSVPLLGPRLSWIEQVSPFIPKIRRYEDDLRDQWQSHAHRAEWRRMLERLERLSSERGTVVTVLSGEIHLATQATMTMKHGDVMRQFVASGVTHPAPSSLFARALGWLAAAGEDPLPGQRIRIMALPGQPRTYTAERNFLLLEQRAEQWEVRWELEESGRTQPVSFAVPDARGTSEV